MKSIRAILLTGLLLSSFHMGHAQQANYFLHTITKGQSLYSIATMYGVTTDEIVSLNPGSEKVIKAGAVLKIPQAKSSATTMFHTIQPGETLYRLSKQYRLPAQAICTANPGLSADNFKVGQVIVIPQADSNATAAQPTSVATPKREASQRTQNATQRDCQDIHKVMRKETIYSICKEYGITEEELIAENPELKTENLKKGKYLRIPYPKKVKEELRRQATEERNSKLSNAEYFDEIKKTWHTGRLGSVNVAVILPFILDAQNNNEQKRMVEYYEGFLMAVDSLKREGYSFNVHTYDSKGAGMSIRPILNRSEMEKMHLIIGPVHANQVTEASDFAKKHNIRLVIPFSSKTNEVYNVPSIYQINTPQSYLYSEVYEHFLRIFRQDSPRIFFVDTDDGNNEKADFIKGLKGELDQAGLSYQTIKAAPNAEPNLKEIVATDRANLFIPISGTSLALNRLFPYLKQLRLELPECPIQLFGYPEWQTYTNDYINEFYAFDTYFYGSFYANNLSTAMADFQRSFHNWYGQTMMNTYPKYAILGFDTGYYFLKGLSLYGNGLEENLSRLDIPTIQTSFKFERVNNWGGFINRKVFFIHFSRDHELLKLDFDI